jgi:hypothetical protein
MNCLVNEQCSPSKQHYLPCVYLKQFSVDGQTADRNSLLWRLSRHGHKQVPVESQCYERNFYSATDSVEAENLFQSYEDLYGTLAQRIWNGDPNRSIREYFGLMFFMVSLHLRNLAYEVSPKLGPRIEVYKLLESQFIHHHLMGSPDCASTLEQQLERLKDFWGVFVYTSASENRLVTSDNPALWFSTDDSGNLHFMILPVMPNSCAIAYNREVISLAADPLSPADADVLNEAQVKSCLKALYSDAPFSEENQQESAEFWTRHKPPSGFINDQEWQPNITDYKGTLSFISVCS